MANFYKKAVGEMSKLRNYIGNLGWNLIGGRVFSYKLNSSRVDYVLARELYHNTNDDYKLGAGFSKSVINTTVGFMGIPRPYSEDKEAEEVLKSFFDDNVSKTQRTLRNALREGDCFVWITRTPTESDLTKLYPEAEKRLIYHIIPPEQVKKINRHPLTNEPKEYVLESHHEWLDEAGNKRTATIEQRVSANNKIVNVVNGDTPPGLKLGEVDNSWGFIPIVHFKNEAEEHEEFGKSDIESIEPFLKAYHDVLIHAIQGSKLHSTPRLKLKLKNVTNFLANNFGVSDPAAFVKQGGSINLDGHEIIFLGDGEDAEFIEARSSTGDASILLKFLFYCIVDTSETPEFAFGVHTPSALASVKEQMPILIRRISRKREQFTESFDHLCRVILAMTASSENRSFSTYKTVLEWDDIDPRSGKEIAEEIKTIIEALDTALTGEFMSLESAVDLLAQYIETMNRYISDDQEIPGERERIITSRLTKMRLEDGQFNEEQSKEIDKLLARMKEEEGDE